MGWEGAAAAAAPAEVAPAGQGRASPCHGPKRAGESCGAVGPRTAPFLRAAPRLRPPAPGAPGLPSCAAAAANGGGAGGETFGSGGGRTARVNWLLFYMPILLH